MFMFLPRTFLAIFATVLAVSMGLASSAFAKDFEVWLVDQSNSNGKTFGGTIHIFDGDDLKGRAASSVTPTDVLDLSGATSALCSASTGVNPVRPHMIQFNSTQSHAVLSFVTSGHVVIFNAATRAPVACLRMSVGAGGARQAHAAFPAPDDSYILVSNQNGKLLERINASFATNTFTLDTLATINLATCITPNGFACQDAVRRPDNAPIVPVVDSSSTLGFITLRGGGLFVVNPKATPMQIIAEYDRETVRGAGFAGAQAAGTMYVNSGGGSVLDPYRFDVYAFPLSGYSAANFPNTPTPDLLHSDDGGPRDAHGLVVTKRERFVWVLDRDRNVAEIIDTDTGANINTVDLNKGGPAGLAPDLAGRSPSGNRIFVSLRGPNPLSGDPHLSTGSTPGLGVIQVNKKGKNGKLKNIIPIHNIDVGGVERADAHGIGVRLKKTARSQGGDMHDPDEEEDEDKEEDKDKPMTKK
ncbi:MAG: hypothetical protein E8D46_05495 [Nitrospira sp.]|nr:MAG: hypothetical protein E8D46_05495 [Nitrospira sp.]